MRRVERHVRPTRLEDAEKGDHHLRRPLDAQAHPRLRSHSQSAQVARQPVGARVELAIRKDHPLAGHRRRLWPPVRLQLEQLVDPPGGSTPHDLRVVPLQQKLLPRGGAEQRQLHQAARRRGDGCGEQGRELLRQARDRRSIEEVGRILQRSGQAEGSLHQVESQIEPGSPCLVPPLDPDRLQVRQRERLLGSILQHQHHLEQWGIARGTHRLQRLDQVLEREVLMRIGLQRSLPGPEQQIPQARPAGQIPAHHQGVGEEPDQRLQLRAAAVGHHRPDGQSLLPREA